MVNTFQLMDLEAGKFIENTGLRPSSIRMNINSPLDPLGHVETIDIVHAEIHDGETFSCSALIATANDASFDYYFIGAIDMHLTASVISEGKAYSYLYSGVTASGGTVETIFNRNRISATVSSATVLRNPTVSSTGTQLNVQLIPGGTGPQSIGSEVRANSEWILKAGTPYLIRVTNKSGQSKDISLNLQWYRHAV